jgi:hypothetical protein
MTPPMYDSHGTSLSAQASNGLPKKLPTSSPANAIDQPHST